jgi:hypothetical protein
VQLIPILASKSKTIQPNATVSAIVTSGGLIKVTTSAVNALESGDIVQISGTVGTVEANRQWIITVIDSTHFTLNNSTFMNAWVSGGTINHCGYSTPCTAFNNFFFTVKPANLVGKILVQSAPQGARLRWSFDDAQLNDNAFLTAMPGPTGSMAGGVSAKSDYLWSFSYSETFPDLILQLQSLLRLRVMFGNPVIGSTFILSSWFEV